MMGNCSSRARASMARISSGRSGARLRMYRLTGSEMRGRESFMYLRRLRTGLSGRLRNVHHHRQQCVIPDDSSGVDDALLSEAAEHSRVRRIADALVALQLIAEVVED